MAEESDNAERIKGIGSDMAETVLRGPAVWSNAVVVTNSQGGIRITFVEENAESAQVAYRTAVFLESGTFLALYRLMTNVIKNDPFMGDAWEHLQKQNDG